MPGDLRTRIAAAIESIRIQRDGDAARMADAVIHELKLHVVTVGDFQTVIKGSYPKPLEEQQ